MDREELVGIQTIWWVDYQLAVGFLTGSWKSNMDVWISNQLFGNPTACLSWPRCNGGGESCDEDDAGVGKGATFSGKSCEPVAGWGGEEEGVRYWCPNRRRVLAILIND